MRIPSLGSETGTGPGVCRARYVSLALLALLIWSCGPPRERFHATWATPEALSEEYLRGLAAEDRSRLEAMLLTKREYLLEVFPEMPVYGNTPPDFAWDQLEGRNHYGVSFVLARQGGRAWDLQGITFKGGTTAYQTFTVHREPMLHLRDRETGKRDELAFFGSILEHGGRYALVSANIDR